MLSSQQIETLTECGFCVVSDVLSPNTVSRYSELTEIARSQTQTENVSNSSGTYGLRNLVDVIPEVAELAASTAVRQLVEPILGAEAFMVRATLFDKTQGANWGVFWHQDLSIAVTQRHDVDGYGAWTKKAGVPCVQPPTNIMAGMLAVRLHLDDCHAGSGALKVLPGTHRHNRLAGDDVDRLEGETEHVLCEVRAGGAVLMRPLLLHASSPMETASSRRVIHFEYANCSLPAPLQWAWQIGPASVS